jgi:hypothetical protein
VSVPCVPQVKKKNMVEGCVRCGGAERWLVVARFRVL